MIRKGLGVLLALLLFASLVGAGSASVLAQGVGIDSSRSSGDGSAGVSFRAANQPSSGRQPSWTKSLPAGIDISHWNGSIDWTRVQATGKVQFVIAKATQGTSFQDPTYAANQSSVAGLTGVRFTAYDFADPQGGTAQAIADANYFVDFASLGKGDMVPVLDLEKTNGFGKRQLQTWVTAWLHQVYVRLGVRAMIYTSPSFFATALGNTTWFAKHGYYLWIAHWGVKKPDVPAKSWAGRSWSVWQWTDAGDVAGIDGNVDRDVFAKRHLGSILIP